MKYLAMLLALVATPALANEKSLTITQFDRVRIEGNFLVEIVTGRGPSARISGSEKAIDRTTVLSQGQTLFVRANHNVWGSEQDGDNVGPITIRLTTAELRSASSSGSSVVKIDRMRGASVNVAQEGSGSLTIGSMEADTLDIGVVGAGNLTITGKAAQLHAGVRGAATLDASLLAVSDLKLVTDGAAVVRATARRSANINASGSGSIVISGRPACTVVNKGSGSVVCGH
ncbi:MAG: hypothetical protein JWO15_409 [Sphingomonadales bacterium]|nr:hypothetical protein [Sphingomonadales bacterium]